MDRLTSGVPQYQYAIQEIITEYAEFMAKASPELEFITSFDTTKHHYQLIMTGWKGYERIYKVLMHFDIIADQIWVQQNTTQFDFIEDFERFGISKYTIVNGMIPAHRRQVLSDMA